MNRMEAICGRWEAWLGEYAPEALASFNAGATDEEIEIFEELVGFALPDDVRTYFRWHNGQTRRTFLDALPISAKLLSLEEANREWAEWQDVAFYNDEHTDNESHPVDAIRSAYSLPGWIPLASEMTKSNYWGVDLSPGPCGTCGQAINFGRDEGNKFVAGASWSDLIEVLVEEMELGRIEVYESIPIGHHWFCRNYYGDFLSLFDIVPQLHKQGLFDGRRLRFQEPADRIIPLPEPRASRLRDFHQALSRRDLPSVEVLLRDDPGLVHYPPEYGTIRQLAEASGSTEIVALIERAEGLSCPE